MRLITQAAERRRVGITTRMSAWIGRHQRQLSDQIHADGDELAHQHGWEITKTTGRLGFGTRSYPGPALRRPPSAPIDRGHQGRQARSLRSRRQARRGGAMRLVGRWISSHSARDQDRVDQFTRLRLTEGKHQDHDGAKPAVTPGDQARPGTTTEAIRALELDQEQARTVLAALEDAAALRREAIGNCPDCRSADERLCTDHAGSWETAGEYDALRWHLESACLSPQADHEAEAATEPASAEHVPLDVPDTSRCVPPEIYNAIADYAREVNRPRSGPDGAPYASPEEEATHAAWSTGAQIPGRNGANGHWNEPDDYQPDREAGE